MTWWRRNRVALLALIPAVLLALATNSADVKSRWWDRGFHWAEDSDGGAVEFHFSYADEGEAGSASYESRGTVRLDRWRSFTKAELEERSGAEASLPKGTTAWFFAMEFAAAPDQVLQHCAGAVEAEDGTLYAVNWRIDVEGGADMSAPCEFGAYGGPRVDYSTYEIVQPETPRPKEWTNLWFAPLPDGVKPVAVRIWSPRSLHVPVGGAYHRIALTDVPEA